ncbi:hypothetical protein [Capsulimonas corticalis]|nr:hypothetical protein [Capsulimonas corticalis]
MSPIWLSLLADISLSLSVLCALVVAVDVSAHPQKMVIMNFV